MAVIVRRTKRELGQRAPRPAWGRAVAAAAAVVAGFGTSVAIAQPPHADVLAYWRFEDGRVHERLQAVRGTTEEPYRTTADLIDPANALRTFNTDLRVWPPNTSPAYSDDVPARIVPRTGEADRRSLRFEDHEDIYTPDGSPINGRALPRFTVEGAFKLERLASGPDQRYQVVIGKDGRPAEDVANAPFQVVVAGRSDDWTVRNAVAVQIIDASGRFISASSDRPVEARRWYWFAATCDGEALSLYLDRGDGEGYALEAREESVEGGLIESDASWTIGRGMHNGHPTMWLSGWIDEVRISDDVLPAERFLASRGEGVAANRLAADGAAALDDETDDAEATNHGTTQEPAVTGPTYTNPVLRGVPDPHVIRAGDEYYVYGTTAPGEGYRVHSSPDLMNWTDRGFAFRKTESSWAREHFWAPCVVERNGRFYLFYSAVGPLANTGGRSGHRLCVAVADSPLGPFEDVLAPAFGVGISAIDAHVFIDDDDQAYLYYVLDTSENVTSEVYGVPLSDDLLSTTAEAVRCIWPSQHWEGQVWNEGPFVFRAGDAYVMMYSANGFFDRKYAVGYAVAASPLGPWVKSSANPILSANEHAVGTGHNSMIRSPDGREWFCVYHAHGDGVGARRRDLYIDRVRIATGPNYTVDLRVLGPTRTPQPMPSGAATQATHESASETADMTATDEGAAP